MNPKVLGPRATLGSLLHNASASPGARLRPTHSSPKAAGGGGARWNGSPSSFTNEAPPTSGPLLGSGLPDPEVTVGAVDAANG